MKRVLGMFAALASLGLASCAGTAPKALSSNGLHQRVFGETRARDVRTLVVVLHDDRVIADRADSYAFARTAAEAIPDSAAVAVLRPGYDDSSGNRSDGERGDGFGDNYTAERIGAVADSIAEVKRRFPHARTVLVGDKGGAAMAANLAGLRQGLIDGMVLVGCPCTLPEWRDHMETLDDSGAWEQPVGSLDPLLMAGGVAPDLRAVVIVGAEDRITPARFSRSYAEALALRGINTDYRILPGRDEHILNDPEVLAATQKLAAALPAVTR